MPRKNVTETVEEEIPVIAEEAELVPEVVEPIEPVEGAVPATVPGRKALGVKEVIPFKWKLLGMSGGYTLTLFKAVERDDVEAQYERALREGYYTDLRVVDVNTKVEQPKAVKAKLSAAKNAKKPTPQKAAPARGRAEVFKQAAAKKTVSTVVKKSPPVKESRDSSKKVVKKKATAAAKPASAQRRKPGKKK